MATTNEATHSGRHRTGRWSLLVSPLLAVISVALGIRAAQLSYAVVRERARTCDGMLPVADSTLVLAWLAVAVAVAAVGVAVRGYPRTRNRDHRALLGTALACFAAGLVALLAVVAIQAWVAVLTGLGALIAGTVTLLLHRRAQGGPPAPAAGLLAPAVLVTALLAVPATLFLLNAVYTDAPTKAHLCSGF